MNLLIRFFHLLSRWLALSGAMLFGAVEGRLPRTSLLISGLRLRYAPLSLNGLFSLSGAVLFGAVEGSLPRPSRLSSGLRLRPSASTQHQQGKRRKVFARSSAQCWLYLAWLLALALLPGASWAAAPTLPAEAEVITPENVAGLQEAVQRDFGPWNFVMALAWSPDSSWLAASAGDGVGVYAAGNLEALAERRLGALTHGLAWSPDGSRLAAASRDGRLRVWSQRGGASFNAPLYTLEAHRKGANRLAFSPNGRLLASGGNDAIVRLWDVESGEELREIIGGTFSIPDLAFSPDGQVLAIVNGDVVRLRTVEDGRIAGTLRAENNLYSLAWQPDQQRVATGDQENGVQLWDVAAESLLSEQHSHQGASGRPAALVWQVAFSPDGRLLASAGGDGSVRLWDAGSGELLNVLEGMAPGVTCLAFSPDGRFLATGGLDGVLRLWSVAGGSAGG